MTDFRTGLTDYGQLLRYDGPRLETRPSHTIPVLSVGDTVSALTVLFDGQVSEINCGRERN